MIPPPIVARGQRVRSSWGNAARQALIDLDADLATLESDLATLVTTSKARVTSTEAPALTSDTGALVVGPIAGVQIAVGNGAIQAKSDATTATTLALNPLGSDVTAPKLIVSQPAGMVGSDPQIILVPRPENGVTGGQLQFDGAAANPDIVLGNVSGLLRLDGHPLAGAGSVAVSFASATLTTTIAPWSGTLSVGPFTHDAVYNITSYILSNSTHTNPVDHYMQYRDDMGSGFGAWTSTPGRFRRNTVMGSNSSSFSFSGPLSAGRTREFRVAWACVSGSQTMASSGSGDLNNLSVIWHLVG